jgi:hypothetical protein
VFAPADDISWREPAITMDGENGQMSITNGWFDDA